MLPAFEKQRSPRRTRIIEVSEVAHARSLRVPFVDNDEVSKTHGAGQLFAFFKWSGENEWLVWMLRRMQVQ